jgi:GH15 family glucan-1,4-alpha-glucosidase
VTAGPRAGVRRIVGGLQTAALVTTDGVADFFCCPRLDSPSMFCPLVDAEKGGYFSIKPAADHYVTKQLYFRLTRSRDWPMTPPRTGMPG